MEAIIEFLICWIFNNLRNRRTNHSNVSSYFEEPNAHSSVSLSPCGESVSIWENAAAVASVESRKLFNLKNPNRCAGCWGMIYNPWLDEWAKRNQFKDTQTRDDDTLNQIDGEINSTASWSRNEAAIPLGKLLATHFIQLIRICLLLFSLSRTSVEKRENLWHFKVLRATSSTDKCLPNIYHVVYLSARRHSKLLKKKNTKISKISSERRNERRKITWNFFLNKMRHRLNYTCNMPHHASDGREWEPKAHKMIKLLMIF